MKRRLAAAILTATVATGAVAMPTASAADYEEQNACVQTVSTPQGSGWQLIGGKWYLLTDDGYRQGWYRENGEWYFLTDRGEMLTGWAEIDGKYYCFGADGIMMTGNAEQDGKSYSLGIDGAVIGEEHPKTDSIYITISGIVRPIAA